MQNSAQSIKQFHTFWCRVIPYPLHYSMDSYRVVWFCDIQTHRLEFSVFMLDYTSVRHGINRHSNFQPLKVHITLTGLGSSFLASGGAASSSASPSDQSSLYAEWSSSTGVNSSVQNTKHKSLFTFTYPHEQILICLSLRLKYVIYHIVYSLVWSNIYHIVLNKCACLNKCTPTFEFVRLWSDLADMFVLYRPPAV